MLGDHCGFLRTVFQPGLTGVPAVFSTCVFAARSRRRGRFQSIGDWREIRPAASQYWRHLPLRGRRSRRHHSGAGFVEIPLPGHRPHAHRRAGLHDLLRPQPLHAAAKSAAVCECGFRFIGGAAGSQSQFQRLLRRAGLAQQSLLRRSVQTALRLARYRRCHPRRAALHRV